MTPWDNDLALQRIRALAHLSGALLPILHSLQEAFGYIDPVSIPEIASALNLSRAEVVGVIAFYPDFRDSPPGRHSLRVCRAEACQAMGIEALAGHIEARLGIATGQTTADGRFTLDAVYCLGNCALSPALMLDGVLHGRVSNERANELLEGSGR